MTNANDATAGDTLTGDIGSGSQAAPRHLIVIGGSAGALEPLRQIVRELRFDMDAAVVIALHHPPKSASFLANILRRETHVPVRLARDGELLEAGHVYVNPPGYHYPIVQGGRLWLEPHPAQQRRGRCADSLFSSAAADFGERCIGVVLSGANENGVAGLRDIRAAGGHALVQDPAEAAHETMPAAALREGADFCGGAEAIGRRLAEYCSPRVSSGD